MSPRRVELIPSAARLMSSLRDLGYEFTNAVADIVDNSIAAGAKRVEITIRFDGPTSWVRVADDGSGMGGTDISEAMRLGTGRTYGDEELGKFGLGLKTASLSQARVITVASRKDPNRRRIEGRRLDLNDVLERDRWEILHLHTEDLPQPVVEPLRECTGTVVLWEQLDRILARDDPFGGWARRQLLNLADDLDTHLGMVFERFLTGKARRRKSLTITINGTKVEPWDPFCLDEDTYLLEEKMLPLGGSMVRWRPFVLPPQRDFSDDIKWKRAAGPRQWNHQQGLYIYRADRLIQSGGWSYLRSSDEHTKLARAALEFWPPLDEQFEINISKMRVKIPGELRQQLTPLVGFLTKVADGRYRKSARSYRPTAAAAKRPARSPSLDSPAIEHQSRPTGIGPSSGGPLAGATPFPSPSPSTSAQPEVFDGGLGDRVAAAIRQALKKVGGDEMFTEFQNEIKRADPEVAHVLGW